jgi:hypothetical protein
MLDTQSSDRFQNGFEIWMQPMRKRGEERAGYQHTLVLIEHFA